MATHKSERQYIYNDMRAAKARTFRSYRHYLALGTCYWSLGKWYASEGKPVKALECFEKANACLKAAIEKGWQDPRVWIAQNVIKSEIYGMSKQ